MNVRAALFFCVRQLICLDLKQLSHSWRPSIPWEFQGSHGATVAAFLPVDFLWDKLFSRRAGKTGIRLFAERQMQAPAIRHAAVKASWSSCWFWLSPCA